MGTGLVALATLLFGASISAILTRTGKTNVIVAMLIGLAVSVFVSTALIPVFPWDSSHLPGALFRLSLFILPFIFASAALGKWLRS